nr:RNA-directed DNA polymerase, eukaryota, reverse transcriptase zinc-binding domain protein [Tanacetum cinerariifolium]
MQAPLRNRFRDLLEADMKEILHQHMWETESYKSHKDHIQLFEALEKSMNNDHSEELAQDLAEARKKKKKSRESPKTPPGSPPHQPPPPPLPAGPSEASGAPGASGSSQVSPPPPLPSSTNQENIESAHIPKVNLRQDWCKPLEEERSATPEPSWSIPSSDAPIPTNNWASALASNYSPPAEDSLLSQTDDIATFMDWFCKRQGIIEVKPQDLEGPAFKIVKVFHHDVIHLQYQMEECHKLLIDSVDDPILRHNISKPLPLGGPPGQVTIQSDFFFNKDLEYLRYGSKGNRPALSISKMKATYYPDAGLEKMVPYQFWVEEECKYDIAAMYGISHWWFQRQRFYIDRHTSKGDRSAVRTHMRILSVVRIEVFSMYGYDYIKKIVLHHADLNEHVIAKRDFKYLYPSDFEDLYLLNLQGHLNHLPLKDKKILTTAVNQWTRHLVIRQRVEDFQLGIESYQTQLNLTKPQWDATGFEYKHDYTVIDSPRAVMFRDKYGVQMMMHFTKIHKFSDGTLQQIDEALDYRVKEFRINRMNPGLNTRFWTRKDVDRSKAFMFTIQKRLKTRRIFRNLESFVGGHVAVCSSLRSLKPKRIIESRAKRSSKIILIEHYSIMLASLHTVKMKMEILLEPTSNKLLVVGFNSLVHSFRALSTLRRFGLRTASTAAKPCQGDSSEFYLIICSIYTDQRGIVVLATLFNEMILEGKVSVVRTKEVTGWVLDFGEDDISQYEDGSDNNSVGIHNLEEANDDGVIPDSFEENTPVQMDNSHVYVKNSHEKMKNSPKHVEKCFVHVKNSYVHVDNSPDLFGDHFGLENKWRSIQKKSIRENDYRVLQDYLLDIDSRLDKGDGLLDDLPNRAKNFHDIGVIDHKISVVTAQKAKVKWAIESDEKSKFFHGIVNKKRCQQAIKCILVEGEWIDNPDRVKREFYNHFFEQLSAHDWSRVPMKGIFPRCLGADSSNDLEMDIFDDEIKRRKEQALLFKVDFQKAFDSVRWDHLGDILGKFGFGRKWRGWIRGCLHSSKASVLVNEKNDFVPISHLFYADDVMFISKWSSSNVSVLMMMLHWFFHVPGLKVNAHKSSLYGLGVHSLDIRSMANSFGCLENNLLFTYLGVKVAANMARINSWNEVIQKVTFKLSNWKAKSLSMGGFWLSVIKYIHGTNGSLDQPPPTCTGCSIWIMVHKAIVSLKSKGIDLLGFCKKVICNGCFVAQKFQNPDFADSFRRNLRGGIEESQLEELSLSLSLSLSLLLSLVVLSSFNDRWSWTLNGHGDFSVKSAREEIYKHLLITSSSSTRWSKFLSKKLNIFSWRKFLDKLPTRINLSNKGFDVPCVLCPNCGNEVESHNHLFFGCSMALDLFRLLGRWWNIDIINLIDPFSWESWFSGLRLNNLQKLALEASFVFMWWHIWKYRNTVLFFLKKPKKRLICDNIVSQTLIWVNNRCRKFNVNELRG